MKPLLLLLLVICSCSPAGDFEDVNYKPVPIKCLTIDGGSCATDAELDLLSDDQIDELGELYE